MKKKKWKKLIIVLGIIVLLLVIQTLPVFFIKQLGSKTMSDKNIVLYYPGGEEKGAKEVFELLKEKSGEIKSKMKFVSDVPTKVYIYSTQNKLALREAGLITLAIAPEWHIGDSHFGNVMMISPYIKVKGHTHDSILNATLHEFVHSIVYRVNPKLSYFWDNGLATYLSNQKPSKGELSSHPIPSIKDMYTENGLKFGEMGGYAFSYNYIEFLEKTYGWNKVIAYAKGTGSYEAIFGVEESEIYKRWNEYVKETIGL